MTICFQCKFHLNTHQGSMYGPPDSAWFYQRCMASLFAHIKAIDPVSGSSIYKDDNGVLTEEKYPYCRDINKGNCSLFDRKTGS